MITRFDFETLTSVKGRDREGHLPHAGSTIGAIKANGAPKYITQLAISWLYFHLFIGKLMWLTFPS